MSRPQVVKAARARKPRAVFCVAALAVVLSASCVESSPAGPAVALIPSDAIAAVVVESPYKLFKSTEEFWKSAALDQTTGSDLQSLLEKSVPDASLAVDVLDFARPWALAVLPGDESVNGAQKTRELLYIPFRSSPDELVSKVLGEGSLKVIAKAKGYLVLSDVEGQISFPPTKAADLSRLTRYSASSIKLWGDPAAIRRAASDGYKPIAEAVRRFVTEPSAKADPAAATKAMGELGLSILAQLALADASIEPGSSGLALRVGASAAKGSDMRKILAAAAASGPSALDWASQVDTGAMYGASWSADPVLTAGLYRFLADGVFSGLGLPLDIAAKAAALQAKWAKVEGPRGAMSLDLDVDTAAIAGAKDLQSEDPAAIADFIKKALHIKVDMFQDIKDEAAYRVLLKGMASDPEYAAFSKAYVDAFGLSFSMKSQEKKDGSFSYGEFGINLKIVDGGKLSALGGASSSASAKTASEAALAALESLLKARWAISNGRMVATTGDLAALKALAVRKAAGKSLAADPAFAAFAKTMPPRTILVGSLSMKKIMSLATEFAKASASGAQPSLPDPSLFSSWYSYLAVDARALAPGIEAGFLIPASDIGAIARATGALKKPASPAPGESL